MAKRLRVPETRMTALVDRPGGDYRCRAPIRPIGLACMEAPRPASWIMILGIVPAVVSGADVPDLEEPGRQRKKVAIGGKP